MRGLGRSAAAIAACVLAALIAVSCGSSVNGSGGSTSTAGAGAGTSTSTVTTGGTGGANTGGAMGTGGNGGTGNVEPKCASNADCATDPIGKVCDTSSGLCVVCLASDDQCPSGQFCDPTTKTCKVGCTDA